MDISRKAVRFAITGGYGLLTTVVLMALFAWAWHRAVGEVFATTSATTIATMGVAVAVGFVLTQIYDGLEERRPRASDDLGGNVLAQLVDIPDAERAIECAHRRRGYGSEPIRVDVRHSRQERRLDMLRSLLDFAADHNGERFVARYEQQVEDYHLYGACRATIVVICATAAIYIAASREHDYTAHLARSLTVSALGIALGAAGYLIFGSRRAVALRHLNGHLTYSLRFWMLTHIELLTEVATKAGAPELPPRPLRDPIGPAAPSPAIHSTPARSLLASDDGSPRGDEQTRPAA